MSSTGRIGLLTGTFDPVHLGHVAMAEAALRECGLDEVWFLVNPDPGHKVGVTDYAHRLAMVRLAVADRPGLRAGAPVGVPKRHRMADFERMMGAYPGKKFVFIVGADVLVAMRVWEDYEPAVARAEFAVARRAKMDEIQADGRMQVQNFEFSDHADASSRLIQGQLRAGARPAELDGRVYDYIREQGLYI